MRVMFMGTPDFSVEVLRALTGSRHEVIAVVTQPDKPKGRGYQLTPPPVKVFALEKGLPVYQPATLRDDAFADLLRETAPDVIVVAAYAKILPKSVLDAPRYGCVNAHASLLPRHRGAAPIQRAIIEGDSETGVVAMQMAEGLDTGDMLVTGRVPILPEDNFESVHDKLAAIGGQVILDALDALESGTARPVRQDGSLATYAAKITKEDCILDFSESPRAVLDRIRGLSPVPLAFCKTPDGKLFKIAAAHEVPGETDEKPGTVLSLDRGEITVAVGGGKIALTSVLPEGKRLMSAADCINGRRVAVGDILT